MADLSVDAVSEEERPIEDVDRALREIDQLLEAWENRLTLDNRRFVDRYLKGMLRLHVHATGRNGAEYCAVFQRSPITRMDPSASVPPEVVDEDARWNADDVAEPNGILFYDCSKEQAMFIADVQLVEDPVSVCSSIVWLQRLDEAHRRLTRSLVFGTKTGFHSVGIPADRETRVASDPRSMFPDECNVEMVKRGPEIVDHVSDDSGEFFWQIMVKMEDVVDPPAIRVHLSCDRVGAEIAPPLDEALTFDEVLLGPFGLDPRAGKWIIQGS